MFWVGRVYRLHFHPCVHEGKKKKKLLCDGLKLLGKIEGKKERFFLFQYCQNDSDLKCLSQKRCTDYY